MGLKAQMSEAELHIITARLQGAKRAAAERGELRFPLAVGYLYDEQGEWIIDPDEEVQAALADLLAEFARTGSAYGVVGAFKDRRFPKRVWGGACGGELRWGALTHTRVVRILQNPCYDMRGRTCSDATARFGSSGRTARSRPRPSSCPAASGRC